MLLVYDEHILTVSAPACHTFGSVPIIYNHGIVATIWTETG